MKRISRAMLVGGAIFGVSCGGGGSPPTASIMAADAAFDRALADGDLAAFAELVAEDAVFLGSEVLEGREQVVAAWSTLLGPEATTSLRWAPDAAEVAASGDLGYTRGRYRMTTAGAGGETATAGGIYVTIWRRGGDGRWRAALDIGTPPEPEP